MGIEGGTWQRASARSPTHWSDATSWADRDLRREVFFFPFRGVSLYGSLFSAATPTRRDGLLVCPSWGVECDRSNPLMHRLAITMARLGGVAFLFHYPGYGNSEGDLATASVPSLAAAATAALGEATRRLPDTQWTAVGFTFGAAIACLTQRHDPSGNLLLLQPDLRPGSYFCEIARKAKRVAFREEIVERLAFGYPAPKAILRDAEEADAAVADAVERFTGAGLAAHYEAPEQREPAPRSLESVTVPGVWRFGAHRQPGLAEAATTWLRERSPFAGDESA